jgi:twitching motility protein PilT
MVLPVLESLGATATAAAAHRQLGDPQAELDKMLVKLVEAGGSDLHITTGAPPTIRLHGGLRYLDDYPPLAGEDTIALLRSVVDEDQWATFEQEHELDFAYSIPDVSRFRVNLYVQRGSFGAAYRSRSPGSPSCPAGWCW